MLFSRPSISKTLAWVECFEGFLSINISVEDVGVEAEQSFSLPGRRLNASQLRRTLRRGGNRFIVTERSQSVATSRLSSASLLPRPPFGLSPARSLFIPSSSLPPSLPFAASSAAHLLPASPHLPFPLTFHASPPSLLPPSLRLFSPSVAAVLRRRLPPPPLAPRSVSQHPLPPSHQHPTPHIPPSLARSLRLPISTPHTPIRRLTSANLPLNLAAFQHSALTLHYQASASSFFFSLSFFAFHFLSPPISLSEMTHGCIFLSHQSRHALATYTPARTLSPSAHHPFTACVMSPSRLPVEALTLGGFPG